MLQYTLKSELHLGATVEKLSQKSLLNFSLFLPISFSAFPRWPNRQKKNAEHSEARNKIKFILKSDFED